MIVDKYKTDLPDSLKDTFAKDTSPLPDDDDTTLEEVDNNPNSMMLKLQKKLHL